MAEQTLSSVPGNDQVSVPEALFDVCDMFYSELRPQMNKLRLLGQALMADMEAEGILFDGIDEEGIKDGAVHIIVEAYNTFKRIDKRVGEMHDDARGDNPTPSIEEALTVLSELEETEKQPENGNGDQGMKYNEIVDFLDEKLESKIQKLRVAQSLFASDDVGFREGAHKEEIEEGIYEIINEVMDAYHYVHGFFSEGTSRMNQP